MEVGDKLKELNMTADEISRLTKAFKDEKFKEMLRDYAHEISDPENRKRYEEEIQLLEQERGNTIDFIHPRPFRAIKTSVDGKQKCFINICSNEKVGKPASKCVVEDGHRGQRWSLPHSLHPGRQDTDPKGNKIMIYDVIFHPDTLHIAGKNKRFMDMVDDTAIQGIQDAFKVTLDKNNVKELKTKYKGTPHPCVIRKPIPGYEARKPTDNPDPLAFPYPDEKRPNAKSVTKTSSDAKPKTVPLQPQQPKEPTTPKYTVKYRSFIDLQDFRCSRDSAQSPRPKEIVVSIDMPLLKSVTDTNLEVTEKNLLLESKKPAYRLELPLAYPVDEDKGEAKFNKQTGQLTITLPVLPSDVTCDLFKGPTADFQNDGESQEDEDIGKETSVDEKVKEEIQTENIDLKQETREDEKDEERGWCERGRRTGEGEQCEEGETSAETAEWRTLDSKGQECEEVKNSAKIPESGAKEKEDSVNEQEEMSKKENGQLTRQDTDDDLNKSMTDKWDGAVETFQCNTSVQKSDISDEENSDDNRASPKTETQHILTSAEESCTIREEATSKMKNSDIQEETPDTKCVQENIQEGTDAASRKEESQVTTTTVSEKPGTTAVTCLSNMEDCFISEGYVMPSAGDGNTAGRGDSDKCQNVQNPEHKKKKDLPVLLREIDKDGKETIISDHSTSAGFIFQNDLIYELD